MLKAKFIVSDTIKTVGKYNTSFLKQRRYKLMGPFKHDHPLHLHKKCGNNMSECQDNTFYCTSVLTFVVKQKKIMGHDQCHDHATTQYALRRTYG